MRGLACNACNVEFAEESAQKEHYRSEWHRYNLRRKVAGVPGVTEGLFNMRLEALAAEKKKADGERLLYRCSLCDKEYSTVKAHAQHLQSKLHVSRASSLPSPADAGVAGVRPAPARPTIQERERSDRADGQVIKEEDEEEDGDSESSEDWEEVDGNEMSDEESIEEVKADGDGLGPSEGELQEWDPSCCFFCDAKSADGSIEGCVEHMHKVHGFFIPDSEYLKDPRGMLSYLGLKVVRGFMCVYCDDRGKQFQSLEAVRKHMEGKSHCKLRYDDDGAVEEELEEFYDFSNSYMSSDGTQLIAAHDGMESHVSLTPGGSELIVKGDGGSKTIGSREFARYYRQRPRPSESRDGVLVNALVARYQSMGLATQEIGRKHGNKPEDMRKMPSARAEVIRSKIALKNNVIRNLPKNCTY
ncbi:unnamed protein product [Sphagnum troendelagicum]|uniref:C2H2-type domain-containing protein n=1 Tax=Sphagnum troendelagicum TaxID=128251 RepID=A0ABP0U1G0_9BRYO